MSGPEKHLQDKCLKYLKDKHIYNLKLFGDGFSGKGKPDIIACINGRFVAFELKVGKNGLQEDQKIHENRIKQSGGLHYIPRDFGEFKQIVDSLMKHIDR